MKRILFLIALLVACNVFPQDVEYFKKIRNLDENGVNSLSEEIASMTRNDFKIASKDETAESVVVTLVKSNLKVEEKENANPDDVFKIVFEVFLEGENEALEIKGVKKYSFYGVEYNYLDLFPFWKKYFVPEATKETVLKEYKYQKSEYRKDSIWWLYKFESSDQNNKKRWLLRKFY